MGGVEVVCAGKITARATLELVRKGVRYSGQFALASEQGLRVLPSTFISSQALKVAQINQLFGDSLRTTMVRSV